VSIIAIEGVVNNGRIQLKGNIRLPDKLRSTSLFQTARSSVVRALIVRGWLTAKRPATS